MSRIATNIDSIIALNNLDRTNRLLGTSLQRLSTGLRINSGKDDPSGLVTGEFLRQEVSQIKAAINNNNRSISVIQTADAALAEITTLLDDIQGIITQVTNDATLSQEEKDALQLTVDSAIASIDRISNITTFAGKKLIDGSIGFTTSGLIFSTATITDVRLNELPVGIDDANPFTIEVELQTSFESAVLTGFALTGLTSLSTVEVQVAGNEGATVIALGVSSTGAITTTAFQDAINTVSDLTGVTASAAQLNSVEFGELQFVGVTAVSGDNINSGGVAEISDFGVDAGGQINGLSFQGQGRRGILKAGNLDIEVTFGKNAVPTGSIQESFTVIGGGAQFQIGQEVNAASQSSLGFDSVHSALLGNFELGHLSEVRVVGQFNLRDDAIRASRIVTEATAQIGSLRGRLGAFAKNTLETTINSLQVAQENISAARSIIVDTDYAQETATLTRLQILVQAGTSALAIANARPQSVLSLLG